MCTQFALVCYVLTTHTSLTLNYQVISEQYCNCLGCSAPASIGDMRNWLETLALWHAAHASELGWWSDQTANMILIGVYCWIHPILFALTPFMMTILYANMLLVYQARPYSIRHVPWVRGGSIKPPFSYGRTHLMLSFIQVLVGWSQCALVPC